jgi:hypothetical protein
MELTKQQVRAIFRSAPKELEKWEHGDSNKGGLVLAGCSFCGEFQTRQTYVTGFWVDKIEIVTDYTCMGIALCKCGKWSHWVH